MSDYIRAERRVAVSVGESLRIIRELQEMSQNDLAGVTGIPQSTISAIENDRVQLGVERAKVLARALKCHPAVLVFPGWDVEHEIQPHNNYKQSDGSFGSTAVDGR
ncbi:MAG: helix-turn-helix transcriptional regulator [Actinobacteria bacterium]|nr:helix-turn-helix transcriptional regulator [Actinomycetota bacterium]